MSKEPDAEFVNQLVKVSAITLTLQDEISKIEGFTEVFNQNFKRKTKQYQQELDKKAVAIFSQDSQELADYLNKVSNIANDVITKIFANSVEDVQRINYIIDEYLKQKHEQHKEQKKVPVPEAKAEDK